VVGWEVVLEGVVEDELLEVGAMVFRILEAMFESGHAGGEDDCYNATHVRLRES
jgi:hypothetical protein